MLAWFVLFTFSSLDDSKPLITQDIVDKINNDPKSPFKAVLRPRFAKMTIGEARKFLSPIRRNPISGQDHGSPRPIGANEREFIARDRRVFTGYYQWDTTAGSTHTPSSAYPTETGEKYKYTVYDNSRFCSSWAPAVTSAMSLAISIHHRRWVNLSIQFILDCDLMGDPCVERPPLNAYEQFWRRYIPQVSRWDQPSNFLRPPYFTLSQSVCNGHDNNGCYPGWQNCPRNLVMTGSCEPGSTDTNCPIYFLYNWRWIKSHLWEVGPVTSSILVRREFFAYQSGVYSSLPVNPTLGSYDRGSNGAGDGHFADSLNAAGPQGDMSDVLGMLDVTIIGWGQIATNLSEHQSYHTGMYNRWWYVIPHLGWEFGESCDAIFGSKAGLLNDNIEASILENVDCPAGSSSGIMRFNRRFDDSSIESQAVGAVPFNFHPLPMRSPKGQ